MPKSPEQFYQEHREDAEKLSNAQRLGNAKNLHEAVSDYHGHSAEAHEAADLGKHPDLYDEARKEMEYDKKEEYSSEVFSKGMPVLTPEQENAVEQMKGSSFPDIWAENRALNIQKKFHLPKEVIQFIAKEVVIYNVKNGELQIAKQLKEEFKIPDFEEYQILVEREKKAKSAVEELDNQRNEKIIDTQFLTVIRDKGVDYIKAYESGLESAIEYIKTHDAPMSVIFSSHCPKNDTIKLLEELDEVAAEKRVPIKIRIDKDCVFYKKEVVAMELFVSKRWRSRIETGYV